MTKQELNKQVDSVCLALLADMLTPEQLEKVTDPSGSFPVTHYKNHDTGEVKLGLSAKGVRKIIKRNPKATLPELLTLVQQRYNLNA